MPNHRQAHLPPGFLSPVQEDLVDQYFRTRPFSIYWEIRALLYLGILFLSTGLGILVYRNIDTLGHQSVLALIGVLTVACLGYCAKIGMPFTRGISTQASSWLDYVLLLGTLLFGVFCGYLQFTYQVFGTHYGLAFFLPACFYLFLAYRFDHRGVLQLAISGLTAAFGIAVTPMAAFRQYLFFQHLPIYTALALAAILALAAALSESRDFKRHFSFSFANFGAHLAMLAALGGMINDQGLRKTAFTLLTAALAVALWKYAQRKQSYYFLLCAVLYGYIGVTYVCIRFLFKHPSFGSLQIVSLYFLLSCAGAIAFFLKMKTFLGKADAGLSEK